MKMPRCRYPPARNRARNRTRARNRNRGSRLETGGSFPECGYRARNMGRRTSEIKPRIWTFLSCSINWRSTRVARRSPAQPGSAWTSDGVCRLRAPGTGRGEVRCLQQPVLRAPQPRGATHSFCPSFQALPRVRVAAPLAIDLRPSGPESCPHAARQSDRLDCWLSLDACILPVIWWD